MSAISDKVWDSLVPASHHCIAQAQTTPDDPSAGQTIQDQQAMAGQTIAGHHPAIAGPGAIVEHKAIAGQAGASQKMKLLGVWTTCCSSIPCHLPNFLPSSSWGLARHCSQELA
jgi:hypothetical protein